MAGSLQLLLCVGNHKETSEHFDLPSVEVEVFTSPSPLMLLHSVTVCIYAKLAYIHY